MEYWPVSLQSKHGSRQTEWKETATRIQTAGEIHSASASSTHDLQEGG